MVRKKIKKLYVNFENIKIKFAGDPIWYYMKLSKFIGQTINVKVVKKRTRTWVE